MDCKLASFSKHLSSFKSEAMEYTSKKRKKQVMQYKESSIYDGDPFLDRGVSRIQRKSKQYQ